MSNPNFDDEDLPDFIREIFKNFSNQFNLGNPNDFAELFKKFNELDPEEVEAYMKKVLGEDFVDKLTSLGEDMFKNMPKNFDPSVFSNFTGFTPSKQGKPKKDIIVEEAAYFEIVEKSETESEIIIDLPGISDQRYINWDIIAGDLKLTASSSNIKYHALIPLPDGASVLSHLAKINNSVFILPLRTK